MKSTLFSTALIAAITLPCFAGTDSAPMSAKDSKDMKQCTTAAQCSSDAGFYVGLFGGANFSQDNGNGRSTYNSPLTPGASLVTHSHDSDSLGGAGGIKAGYKFQSTDIGGGFALQPAAELEAFYLGTNLDLNDSQGSLFYGGTHTTSSADLNSAAFFANGILNFKTPWKVTPYIGAGIGAEYMSLSDKTLNNHIETGFGGGGFPTPTIHSSYGDNIVAFAVQAIAGVNYALTDHWTVFTEYKFVAAIDPSFSYNNVYVPGDSLKYNPDFIGQHLVTAGVKYNF